MELSSMRERLTAFVEDVFDSNQCLGAVEESDGHAGLTYLFDVREKSNSLIREEFVIKIPPAGVKLKGNTDVLRQAPLLNALHNAGLPVPHVPYFYQENSWFERPFIVMERLAGRVFFVWEPYPTFPRSGPAAAKIWSQCVEQLAPLHQFDWQQHLPQWEAPEKLLDNVGRWQKIYQQALDPRWSKKAAEIEALLIDYCPKKYTTGLFHGDFQPGNMLYDGNKFVAIIDWELAGISAQLLDLGWLLMVCDCDNWIEEYHPVSPISEREVLNIYQQAMGHGLDDVPWFQAFAGFRLASIACLNHKLHETGKRPEPAWVQLGKCVMPMLNKAERLLSEYP